MPVIVLSLAHCTNKSTEQQQPKEPAKTTESYQEPSQITVQAPNRVQPCANQPLASRIEVDISKQQLYLYCRYADSDQEQVKTYPVSTSKYGIGNRAGSDKTPLGQARRATGRIAEMNVKGAGDLVTTRIMWLKGLEPGKNRGRGIDSHKRYIYIHGTAEENKIGQPASHGCVRMYNSDVIDLFDRVPEGTKVYIKR
ncbi:MAG: hypothetical protein B6247_22475 [Candidatus Parabeggiatoa sp. nov. 2]|nr:MAG: hypothetical protein B6247_22475 [Beggiatoa sp. 4572_84]